jgi:hypothetical protein
MENKKMVTPMDYGMNQPMSLPKATVPKATIPQPSMVSPSMMPSMPNMMPNMPSMMPNMANMMPSMPIMPAMMPAMPNMMPNLVVSNEMYKYKPVVHTPAPISPIYAYTGGAAIVLVLFILLTIVSRSGHQKEKC